MKIIGIICEYNPFHLGHKKQFDLIRVQSGADCGIVCLMSGNYVQRGAPAVVDKSLRARAAVLCGADLVLELPVTCALSSAEGFADGGVRILSGFCDGLSFGAETGNRDAFLRTAEQLLSPRFPPLLRRGLDAGKSFPAARQQALEEMGGDGTLLSSPNNILAVEYCKAILRWGSGMEVLPVTREGDYHDGEPDSENPSATAVRNRMLSGKDWTPYVPEPVRPVFENAPLHSLGAGERAILGKLRVMTEAEFETVPYGSEGLWRKFMAACRREATVEEILTAVKSKRYTRTRLDRMLMCAFLGISQELLESSPPYTRALAMNDRGREILKKARLSGLFPHTGEQIEDPFQELERRCDDLYGLFCITGPEQPGTTEKRRIYLRNE